ncbi:FecCD family ABC transporter permease [Desertimonas flava]|uniref:FecCD family ABC transporter permease n=1 Tax=Desertimonas flava TaxID=2064846 RepID=UPI000E34FC71|nr:iron chelate uptake ABC transporter family permease subunit [Desertimonas flava]
MTAAALTPSTLEVVVRGRRRRTIRRRLVGAVLVLGIVAIAAVNIMMGHTSYGPGVVWRVILGEDVPKASFTVGRLRLPRTALAFLSGVCFGMGGATFQTMLRNPLASPDVIGISSGASAAAAFAIVVASWSGAAVSAAAIVAGLSIALAVYVLSFRDGVAGTRLILVGIGIAAMLNSIIAYILSTAGQWDLQLVLRWLTGSLNGTRWSEVVPVLISMAVLVPLLLGQARNLGLMRIGDDSAAALGVRVERTRVLAIVAAVGLVCFATAASGPIAFVAFLSGPIAARLFGPGATLLVPAAGVGALLVLVADFAGQYAFSLRYPVGVVTGLLGAPYLVYLIVRSNRAGGSM